MKVRSTTQCLSAVFLVALFIALGSPIVKAQDEIRQQLDNARVVYDEEMEKYQKDVSNWFEKADTAARNVKSNVADSVAAVKREKEAFEADRTLPKHAPSELKTRPARIGDALSRAFRKASDDYSRKKMDDEAGAINQEREQFELTRLVKSINTAQLVGTIWDMSYKYQGEEKYLHRIELSKDGLIRGSKHPNETFWEIEKGKLYFRDNKRQVTSVFDQLKHQGANITISGVFVPKPNCIHVLESISKDPQKKTK